MAAAKIELDLEQLRREVIAFAERFGETSRQAVVRAAVSVAREAAVQTLPRGGDKGTATKKKIERRINRGVVLASVVLKDKKMWSRIKAQKRPRLRDKDRWTEVRPEQFVDDKNRFSEWVDKVRGGNANPSRYLQFSRKAIVWPKLVKDTQRLRRKRAGIAKGGWLGAGMEAARMQRGGDRISIGKNYMSWAQKHSKWGRAERYGSRQGGEFGVGLKNKNPYLRNLWTRRLGKVAGEIGWRKTLRHYERLVKRAERS